MLMALIPSLVNNGPFTNANFRIEYNQKGLGSMECLIAPFTQIIPPFISKVEAFHRSVSIRVVVYNFWRAEMEGWDPNTKSTLTKIPLLSTRAGPRDGAAWTQRLKEEYQSLIKYMGMNKSNDNDWFRISANADGTKWTGKCWYIHNLLKYEFNLQFDIPVTYPATAPEIELPELDGKTAKMYRGGKICLTIHFKPLWAKNCPRFGIAHALCLGLAPWLAAEVPHLVDTGMVKHKDDVAASSVSQA